MTNAPRRAEKHDMHDDEDIQEEAVGSETETPDSSESAAEASNEAEGEPSNVASISDETRTKTLRMVEALLFAASEPLDVKSLAQRLPEGTDVPGLLTELQAFYAPRGVNLVPVGGKWLMRTAEDLSFLLQREAVQMKKLSRPAMETLAIIAYHQPVTRAEIEEIRGVSVSSGTLDVLLETGWMRLRGRRKTPGRPLTYGTSEEFLVHFGLESVRDLPGVDDLKAAGLLDARLPPDFSVPQPDDAELAEDEEELADDDSGEELLIGEASDEVIPAPVEASDDEAEASPDIEETTASTDPDAIRE